MKKVFVISFALSAAAALTAAILHTIHKGKDAAANSTQEDLDDLCDESVDYASKIDDLVNDPFPYGVSDDIGLK